MTRIIERTESTPKPINKSELPPGEAIYVCRCGLSKSAPFCDGSHKRTFHEEPGKLYRYVEASDGPKPVLIKIENA